MPRYFEDFSQLDTVHRGGWKAQAGDFHAGSYDIRCQNNTDDRFRTIPDASWLEGDLTGAAKRISRFFPVEDGSTISLEWRFVFQMDAVAANNLLIFHLFANQEAIDSAAAGYNAYAVSIDANAATFSLLRYTGGGGVVTINSPGWSLGAADTDQHTVAITREVSGANRFWRMYMDGYLMAGPTNDATYTVATYMGFETGSANRQKATDLLIQW